MILTFMYNKSMYGFSRYVVIMGSEFTCKG